MSFEVEDLAARLGALEDTRYLEFLNRDDPLALDVG